MAVMLRRDATGHGVELRVTGYQFPEAEDPRQRYSWHMVEGHAWDPEGDWPLRYSALTCDETPTVSAWLRAAATQAVDRQLRFTEPNLGFAVVDRDDATVSLRIELDLEFLPPWRKTPGTRISAGDPWVIRLELPAGALLTAADEWDSESAPYLDGLAGTVE